MARNHPWPKALKILFEHGSHNEGCKVLALCCEAVFCETCQWTGPLRDNEEDARTDQVDHLLSEDHKHLYYWQQQNERERRRAARQTAKQ